VKPSSHSVQTFSLVKKCSTKQNNTGLPSLATSQRIRKVNELVFIISRLNKSHVYEGEFRLPSKLSYLGLTLLLTGVVCLAFGEVNLRNVQAVQIGIQDSVWSYAYNLTDGRTYGVDIASSDDWGKPFGSGQFTVEQPVNVTITSPGGGLTTLQAFFYGLPSSSPYYKVGTPPTILYVTYQKVDDMGLTVDASSSQIRFTAKQSGPYNVSVLQQGLWSKEPPDYIMFYEELAPNKETYTLLASGGGLVGTLGGVTFIVSLFRSRGVKRKRTRK